MKRKLRGRCFSDSSAARGACGRLGSGKLRHVQTRFLWLQERLKEKAKKAKKKGAAHAQAAQLVADAFEEDQEDQEVEAFARKLNVDLAAGRESPLAVD